jgi:hypothetical protein
MSDENSGVPPLANAAHPSNAILIAAFRRSSLYVRRSRKPWRRSGVRRDVSECLSCDEYRLLKVFFIAQIPMNLLASHGTGGQSIFAFTLPVAASSSFESGPPATYVADAT